MAFVVISLDTAEDVNGRSASTISVIGPTFHHDVVSGTMPVVPEHRMRRGITMAFTIHLRVATMRFSGFHVVALRRPIHVDLQLAAVLPGLGHPLARKTSRRDSCRSDCEYVMATTIVVTKVLHRKPKNALLVHINGTRHPALMDAPFCHLPR